MSVSATAAAIGFRGIHPVCPVLDMPTHLSFWRSLGFEVNFSGGLAPEKADYLGIARDSVELHLQTFAEPDLKRTQIMAIRIEMASRDALETLHAEWAPRVAITAALADKPWGTREFGFYDPVGTPFFFYVDRTW